MSEQNRIYPVPSETLSELGLAVHLADLLEFRDFLESRGIATKNTRIERYCEYFERVLATGSHSADFASIFKNSDSSRFRSPHDWALYMLREAHELMWILKGLKVHVPKGIDPKLRIIVSGRDFAALDTDSQSRNTQFELRIASYFCQGGCEVDLSQETDVIAFKAPNTFIFECKRIGSKAQVGKRLSEARSQLSRALRTRRRQKHVVACIAADITKVAYEHNGLTFGLTPDHSRDSLRKKLISLGTKFDRFLNFESCERLLGYWLQIHIPAGIMIPRSTITRFTSLQIARRQISRHDLRALHSFYNLFESVSKSDERGSAPQKLTPRRTACFPAGSLVSVQYDRIVERMHERPLAEDERAEIVATLEFNGKTDEFTHFEVEMLPKGWLEEWKVATSASPAAGYCRLVAELYLRRYPFEESER